MIKVKNTREFFLDLYQKLSYLDSLTGNKFAFTISKNKEVLLAILKKVQKMVEVPEDYKEYEKKRVELNKKYSLKKEDGTPETDDRNYKIDPDKQEEFNKEIEALKSEYSEVVKKREEQIAEVNDYVREEIEVELRSLSLDMIPKEITVEQMDFLSYIVVE